MPQPYTENAPCKVRTFDIIDIDIEYIVIEPHAIDPPRDMPMGKRKPRVQDWETEAVRFAQLWATGNFTSQEELARREEVAQGTASRYLNYAFGKKILLKGRPTFHLENVPDDVRKKMGG